jgi:hypothetical protein
MGAESICRVTWRERTGEGKALLETEELQFRGPFSLKIPFKCISKIVARGNRRKRIKANGAIWIVYPKGQQTITEADVRTASLSAGLVDVKAARISAPHTGLKVVIPAAKRKKGR